MEIRNRRDETDLRGALAVRDRAWRVGYRGVVDGDVIEAARTEPTAAAAGELAEELENEAGAFLVADAGGNGAEGAAGDGADESDDADGDDATGGDGTGSADDGDAAGSDPGDDVVGYVRVRWGATAAFVDALDAEVVELYVDPAHWREGIGTALLASAVDWSPGTLEGVAIELLAANERGRSFLEAAGFEPTGAGETTIGDASLETARYRLPIQRGGAGGSA